MSTSYFFQASGGRANINSAEFYSCSECAACIIEMDRKDTARQVHDAWHRFLETEVTA